MTDNGVLHEHAELIRGMGPEEQIPLAPLPREGLVSGARKGTRLPAFGGIDRNTSCLLHTAGLALDWGSSQDWDLMWMDPSKILGTRTWIPAVCDLSGLLVGVSRRIPAEMSGAGLKYCAVASLATTIVQSHHKPELVPQI